MRFEYLFKGVCCAVRLERSACMLRRTQLATNNKVAAPPLMKLLRHAVTTDCRAINEADAEWRFHDETDE